MLSIKVPKGGFRSERVGFSEQLLKEPFFCLNNFFFYNCLLILFSREQWHQTKSNCANLEPGRLKKY